MDYYGKKLCDFCKERIANHHVCYNNNGYITELDICDECIAANPSIDSPFVPEDQGVFDGYIIDEMRCSVCHTPASAVEKSMYVGCAECYNVFRKPILNKVLSMFGTRKHIGKKLTVRPKAKNIDTSDMQQMLELLHLAQQENRMDDAEEIRQLITDVKNADRRNKDGK